MRRVLEAVEADRVQLRAVIEECQARLATLAEIELLAHGAVQDAAALRMPVAADPPAGDDVFSVYLRAKAELEPLEPLALPEQTSTPVARPAKAKTGDRESTRAAVFEAIKALQPARKGMIHREVKTASYLAIDKAVAELERTGRVHRTGVGAGTRYHITVADPQPKKAPAAPTPVARRAVEPPPMSARTRRAVDRDRQERQAPPKPPERDGTPDEERFENPNRPEGVRLRQLILDRCRQRPMTKRQLAQLLVVPLVEVGIAVDRIQRNAGNDDSAPRLVKDSSTGTYRTEDSQ